MTNIKKVESSVLVLKVMSYTRWRHSPLCKWHGYCNSCIILAIFECGL